MLGEKIILKHTTELVTSGDQATHGQSLWSESVLLVLVKAWQVNTTWDEDRLGHLGNSLKWTLDSVKDSLENTYTPFIIKFLKDISVAART